ncbi:MAG TPA: hypothetical protein VK589_29940 [Chryseolinea sp.]|nr:hypothetical protein [Chryseolinea sp.]
MELDWPVGYPIPRTGDSFKVLDFIKGFRGCIKEVKFTELQAQVIASRNFEVAFITWRDYVVINLALAE